jgi:prepilin-type N-terminal cleavage/methylation domain-containing protein/prepilin-type processing-associated H-X9-DG protein
LLLSNKEKVWIVDLMSRKRKGFTLIELLVVIAIIALLMSILMPALRKVRDQAKSAICMQRLQQWGLVFSMYTDDNDGFFHGELGVGENSQGWVPALRPYYSSHGAGANPRESRAERDIRLCPSAKIKFRSEGYVVGSDVAWGIYSKEWAEESGWALEGDCGSYGLNAWVCNEEPWVGDWWEEVGNLWRTPNVKGASTIPLFMDCGWVDGWPQELDEPPEWEGEIGSYDYQAMKQFCIDRHGGGTVNSLFLDWSVRKIGLKELWKLKWHRSFDTNGPWTIAGFGGDADACASAWDEQAPWMSRFPEY